MNGTQRLEAGSPKNIHDGGGGGGEGNGGRRWVGNNNQRDDVCGQRLLWRSGKKKIITTTGFDRSGSLKSEARGSPGVVPCGWRKCGGEK